MQLKININFFVSKIFFEQLAHLNIKHAVISPGSRNTPLVLALAENKKIKKIVIVDERSAGFFALGIAKKTKSPVILVCTSGTAAAEYFPAIIEAYQSNIPLIVCTADRPEYLYLTGANQTINQINLYNKFVKFFKTNDLPTANLKHFKTIKIVASQAYISSISNPKGPVHINFPFEKPFEPESYTDEISNNLLKESKVLINRLNLFTMNDTNITVKIIRLIKNTSNVIITVGPLNEDEKTYKSILDLSKKGGYPIFADSTSNLRFTKFNNKTVLSNPDAILRSDKLRNKFMPDLIIHFGLFNTSVYYEHLLKDFKGKRIVVNESGNKYDPVNFTSYTVKSNIKEFCEVISENIIEKEINKEILLIDSEIGKIKNKALEKFPFNSEPSIANEILNIIPDNSNLFLSNSLPIRDFDFFASKIKKNFSVYSNRGASGIDGIVSTALGISSIKEKTILVTGDLAFYYDLNALQIAKENKIPIIIFLINNDGGGIFSFLPISKNKNFKKYFQTPLNINFKLLVEAFYGNYFLPENIEDLKRFFNLSLESKYFSVIEIKTNEKKSLYFRKEFWNSVRNKYLTKNGK